MIPVGAAAPLKAPNAPATIWSWTPRPFGFAEAPKPKMAPLGVPGQRTQAETEMGIPMAVVKPEVTTRARPLFGVEHWRNAAPPNSQGTRDGPAAVVDPIARLPRLPTYSAKARVKSAALSLIGYQSFRPSACRDFQLTWKTVPAMGRWGYPLNSGKIFVIAALR